MAKIGLLSSFMVFALSAHIARGGLIAVGTSEDYLDNRELANRIGYADDERSVTVMIDGAWNGAPADLYVDGTRVLSVGATEVGSYVLPAAGSLGTYTLEFRSGDETAIALLTVLEKRGSVARMGALSSDGQFLDSRPAGTVRVLASASDVLPTAYSSFWTEGATGAEVRVFDQSGRELTTDPLVSEGEGAEGIYPFSPSTLELEGFRFKLTHFDGQETLEAFVRVKGGGLMLIFR